MSELGLYDDAEGVDVRTLRHTAYSGNWPSTLLDPRHNAGFSQTLHTDKPREPKPGPSVESLRARLHALQEARADGRSTSAERTRALLSARSALNQAKAELLIAGNEFAATMDAASSQALELARAEVTRCTDKVQALEAAPLPSGMAPLLVHQIAACRKELYQALTQAELAKLQPEVFEIIQKAWAFNLGGAALTREAWLRQTFPEPLPDRVSAILQDALADGSCDES